MNGSIQRRGKQAARCLRIGYVVALIGCSVAWSQESAPDPRMPGVFDTELPQTGWSHRLRFILRPHFGDLLRHDHLRVPLGLRYGVSENLEASAEVETFLSHGLGSGSFGSRVGLSAVRLGAKERLPRFEILGDTAGVVGISFLTPFGSPPEELTDGRRHVSPYLTFSRAVPGFPRLSGFTSFGADLSSATRFIGVRRKNAFLDDSLSLTTGAVWRGERIVGTLELGYATSAFGAAENRQVFSVRPGVSWRVPNSRWLHPDGKWIVGVGTRVGFGPDGTDVGFGVKFRREFDLRRWVNSLRE
jgi:hypothetical protein